MYKRFSLFFITCIIILPFLFVSYSYAKPPKPGPNFVWVKSHTIPNGNSITGHWKYAGHPKKEKVWVPGHHAPNGKWVPGQWESLSPSNKSSVWIPGHHGARGRWIPGHWR